MRPTAWVSNIPCSRLYSSYRHPRLKTNTVHRTPWWPLNKSSYLSRLLCPQGFGILIFFTWHFRATWRAFSAPYGKLGQCKTHEWFGCRFLNLAITERWPCHTVFPTFPRNILYPMNHKIAQFPSNSFTNSHRTFHIKPLSTQQMVPGVLEPNFSCPAWATVGPLANPILPALWDYAPSDLSALYQSLLADWHSNMHWALHIDNIRADRLGTSQTCRCEVRHIWRMRSFIVSAESSSKRQVFPRFSVWPFPDVFRIISPYFVSAPIQWTGLVLSIGPLPPTRSTCEGINSLFCTKLVEVGGGSMKSTLSRLS